MSPCEKNSKLANFFSIPKENALEMAGNVMVGRDALNQESRVLTANAATIDSYGI